MPASRTSGVTRLTDGTLITASASANAAHYIPTL